MLSPPDSSRIENFGNFQFIKIAKNFLLSMYISRIFFIKFHTGSISIHIDNRIHDEAISGFYYAYDYDLIRYMYE